MGPDSQLATRTQQPLGAVFVSIPFGDDTDRRTGAEAVRYSSSDGDRMAAALGREIELRSSGLKDRSFATLFYSGGPSLLSLDQLYRTLQALYDNLSILPQEQTMAVAPGSVDEAKAKVLRESGFDRVELHVAGPQALGDFWVLRESGFTSVGLELEYDPDPEAWARTLDFALGLDPDHVTLGWAAANNKAASPRLLQSFRLARERLSASFHNYALHRFCRAGHESRHDLAVLGDQTLVGFGPAAVTRFEHEETSNPARVADYLRAVKSGKALSQTRPADESRLKNAFARLDGVPEKNVSRVKSKALVTRGLLVSRGGSLYLTDEGALALDAVARELSAVG